MTTILIADDDQGIVEMLRRTLAYEGYTVVTAMNGQAALDEARGHRPDLVVLDWLMPGLSGVEVARRLRAVDDTPILMLTARDAVEDRVTGLDGGADDYVTKPFSFTELLARLRALLRRGPIERPVILNAGELALDPAARRVWRGETEIDLSSKEFALLESFMRRPGDTLTRFQLLEQVWDYDYENKSNVIDVYVRYLRDKIDRPFQAASIETVRGTGYRLRPDGGRNAGRARR